MNEPNPPPAEPKSPTTVQVLESIRKRALELDVELSPMTRDAAPPGAQQKTARRLQKTLGLVVELCDFIENNVLTKSRK